MIRGMGVDPLRDVLLPFNISMYPGHRSWPPLLPIASWGILPPGLTILQGVFLIPQVHIYRAEFGISILRSNHG